MITHFRKAAPILVGIAIFAAGLAGVEGRTFTDAKGKSIEADLMAVYGDRVSLRFPSGKTAEVLVSTLSKEDQDYVRDWDKGKKVEIMAGDLHLKIEKFTKPAPPPKKGGKKKGGGGKSMMTNYKCVLDNYSLKRIDGLRVDYTIYKRINLVGGANSTDQESVYKFSKQFSSLEPSERLPFETKFVVSTDSVGKDKRGLTQKRNETVIGIVMNFKVGKRTILKQSFPDVFITRLKEEAARQGIRDREEQKREETRAKEEALRRGSRERIEKMNR